jgi:hypothetical protein
MSGKNETMIRKYIRVILVRSVLMSVIMLASASPTFARSFYMGPGGGAYLPVGNTEVSFDVSPGIHGTVLFGVTEGFRLEGCLSYWMLQDAGNVDTFKAITAGFRWDVGHPTVHVDTGVSAYNYTDFGSDNDDAEVSNYNGGVYGGIGVELGSFDVKIRVHVPDADGVYLDASVTYLFDIGKLFKGMPTDLR